MCQFTPYYDAEIGRFISEDSVRANKKSLLPMLGNAKIDARYEIDDPLSLNLYTYCYNNPINLFDPTGHKAGDLFKSQDDAAKDFGNTYNKGSINDNKEYIAVVYEVTKKEKVTFLFFTWEKTVTYYTYTEPDKGSGSSATVPSPPDGKVTIAILHTHAAYDPKYDNENFSDADKNAAKSINGYIYVVTPGGKLKRYDPNAWFTSTKTISKKMPKDPNSPD
jgi:RHS repeat-associated protein